MKRFLLIVLCLAMLAGGAIYAMHLLPATKSSAAHPKDDPANSAMAAPAVSVTRVQTAEFIETVTVSGSLIPREEILVSPEVEGLRVLELKVDEGDRVKAGQVLATLVRDQLDAQVAQNDASQARADAAIAQANSKIAEADARVAQADADFERAKPLKQSGYLAGTTFDQRQAAARTARALLVAARDGLKVAEAEKAQIEAQRRELDWRRGNADVTAPADGLVSRRTTRIGAMASGVAEPMFRIIAKGEIELDAEIVETRLGKVRAGQIARVTVPGAGEFEGKVRLVSPEVDKATRLGKVRIFLGDIDGLHIGAFARGAIDTARGRGLAVPSSAVIFDAEGAHVQAVVGNRVVKRMVKTGLAARDLIEIREGLSAGELVVTRSGTFLRDGDTVRAMLPDDKISEIGR